MKHFLFAILSIGLLWANSAVAEDCHGVTVQGCGKEEKVCVDNAPSAEAAKGKAIEAFKDKNACADASAPQTPVSCASAKCDVRVSN